MHRRVPLAFVVLLAASSLQAQEPKPKGVSSPPDRAVLQQVLDAWGSLDITKPAAFYAADPGLAFYDIAPRKYNGWAEYEKGAADLFKTLKSLTFKVGDDAQVHRAGNMAWATALVDGDMLQNDGSSMKMAGRWTTIWQMRAGRWLIVHDHFSVPLPEPAPTNK